MRREYSIHQQDIHKQLLSESRVRAETLTKRKGSDLPSPGRKWHLVKDPEKDGEPFLRERCPRSLGTRQRARKKSTLNAFQSINTESMLSSVKKSYLGSEIFKKYRYNGVHTHTHTHTQSKIIKRETMDKYNSHTHTHITLYRQLTSSFIVIYTHHHVQNSQPMGSCRRSMGTSAWGSATTSGGGRLAAGRAGRTLKHEGGDVCIH